MASGKAILGGALAGIGETFIQRAEAMRQEALERARELREQEEKEDDRNFRRGLLTSVKADEKNRLVGITQGGETKDLGVTVAPPKDRDSGGLSAGDQRLWNVVRSKYTRDGLQGETTDWASMARELAEVHQRPDLAKLAQPAQGAQGVDVESPEWRQAEQMADDWISGQAGLFRTDATDFKDFEGNREQARQAKTLEIYQQLTGQAPAPAPAAGGAAPASKPSNGQPQFQSADEVKAAYQRGDISREQAISILRSQFGMT